MLFEENTSRLIRTWILELLWKLEFLSRRGFCGDEWTLGSFGIFAASTPVQKSQMPAFEASGEAGSLARRSKRLS
jgi:hypothetical protein